MNTDGLFTTPQRQRIGEQLPQHIEILRIGQAPQIEAVDSLGRAGEVGVDLEAAQVAHNQQRRVLQVLAIKEQLVVGGQQILVLGLVLPTEVAAHPDVGPALTARCFTDAPLETERSAIGISGRGLVLAQQFAEIEKVLLAGAAFAEIGPLPLGDEFLRRQVCGPCGLVLRCGGAAVGEVMRFDCSRRCARLATHAESFQWPARPPLSAGSSARVSAPRFNSRAFACIRG